MKRRAASKAANDRQFNRLAGRFDVPRHMLEHEDAADTAIAGTAEENDTVQRQESTEALADSEQPIEEEIEVEDTNEDDDVAEQSLTLPSDSASEGLSSDLSLPHSFGHYDLLSTGRGISHFDDHLTLMSTENIPLGTTDTLHQAAATTWSTDGSERMMKKFYELQVGKIRAQLALSIQAHKEIERTLLQERALWQQKEAEMQHQYTIDKIRAEKELEQGQTDLMTARKCLEMEKVHFANLEISDALAEQLSRQNEEDLSIREFIQLRIHSKVRKLEVELENCRQEVEALRKSSRANEAVAAKASDEISQIQRIAEAKEKRLQHELKLSEETRQELENHINTLVIQVDEMKEEQRRNEKRQSDQRTLQNESERLTKDLEALQQVYNDLKSRSDQTSASSEDLYQKVALLTADKTFLQDAKAQLEAQVVKLRLTLKEMEDKVSVLQEKHDHNFSQSVQIQNETRLHFEKKLDDEMGKFMELSKREIERIRNDGQVVYERENRLLKEARDDALKHTKVLQARLDSVQSTLDEKILETTRMESVHTTTLATAHNELKMRHFEISQLKLSLEEKASSARSAQRQLDMLLKKVEVHKEEFTRLETTSTTRISQLEALLEVERSKLKEYVQLEIDLDKAVIQSGEIAAIDDRNGSRVQDMMKTFEAIPTTTKRRFQQSVFLAQKIVKTQRELIAMEQKLTEVTSERTKLEQEAVELKAKLESFHQPQSYLIEKLSRREKELQAAVQKYQEGESKLQQLKAQYQQVRDANISLQHQLQQLLTRREDLDALKATVQALRSRIQSPIHHEQLQTVNQPQPTPPVTPLKSPMLLSPPASSIVSKMTQRQKSEVASISSTPKWYTKLRTPAQ